MTAITVICVLHYFFALTVPLVMSVTMNIFGLMEDPLVRIYLRGHHPDYNKSLVRPFKLANPMENVKRMQEAWGMTEETAGSDDSSDGQSEKNTKSSSTRPKR